MESKGKWGIKMNNTDVLFEEKILKLKTKLVIYGNVLGNKNIYNHELIGIKRRIWKYIWNSYKGDW